MSLTTRGNQRMNDEPASSHFDDEPLSIETIEAKLEANPNDTELKKELAYALLDGYLYVTDDTLTVRLMDGRTISVPLVWYPRLSNSTPEQRKNCQIIGGGYGIHWEDIDEDLSTEGLLRGAPAPR